MKSLREFAPGASLVVEGFDSTLTPEARGHLSAWGLMPGPMIELLSHQPVTRLMVEHAELALEDTIANGILASLRKP